MSDELKPCPWCPGFTLRIIETRPSSQPGLFESWVRCLDCGACGPVQVDGDLLVCQSEAREEYNTRAQPAATGGRVVEHPPEYIHEWTDDDYDKGKQIGMDDRDEEWRAALAKAGVRVSE